MTTVHTEAARVFQDGRHGAARRLLETADPLSTGHVGSVLLLARACRRTYHFIRCEEACRWLLERNLRPRAAADLLATALRGQGRPAEAVEAYRELHEEHGLKPKAHSRMIFSALFDPAQTTDSILELNREYARCHGPGSPPDPGYPNQPDPERTLRVGFVGSEYRDHSKTFFTRRLFEAFDRQQVCLHVYSSTSDPDHVTRMIADAADVWRDIRESTDREVRDRIAEDRIDILVDNAGHASGNRLPCLLSRPAPVLVEYGEPPSGLEAFDYRITDAVVDPPDASTEGAAPFRLAHGFHAFGPWESTQEAARGSRPFGDRPVLGCFNVAAKLNAHVLETWSKLLHRIPEAILLLKNGALAEPAFAERVRRRFAEGGIDPSRVRCYAFTPGRPLHYAMYGLVDLALDTFPYNGVTSTCEALWMGTPVVTLRGERHESRRGASLLTSAGMADWVADDVEGYLEIAAERLAQRRELDHLHTTLRARVLQTPLGDVSGLARNLEEAFRTMWRQWCATISRPGSP